MRRKKWGHEKRKKKNERNESHLQLCGDFNTSCVFSPLLFVYLFTCLLYSLCKRKKERQKFSEPVNVKQSEVMRRCRERTGIVFKISRVLTSDHLPSGPYSFWELLTWRKISRNSTALCVKSRFFFPLFLLNNNGDVWTDSFQFSHQGQSKQTHRPVAPAVWLHTVKRSTLFRDQPDQYKDRETYFWKFPCLSCVRGIAQRWMDQPGFSDIWVGRETLQNGKKVQRSERREKERVRCTPVGFYVPRQLHLDFERTWPFSVLYTVDGTVWQILYCTCIHT